MSRVLVVGYHAWDIIIPWSGSQLVDGKYEIEAFHFGGGGPAATAAVVMSSLGMKVQLLSSLTSDPPGLAQIAELEAAGVDLGWCPRSGGATSPHAVILVDSQRQSRTIFWSRGNLPPLDPTALPPDILAGVDLLYSDGHETPAALHLAGQARERGLPVVLDAGSVRPQSAELVSCCTDVIASSEFIPALTHCQDSLLALEKLRSMGPQRVGVTLGKYGVLGLDEDGFVVKPAFAVDVKDTTGAGDVFHAGYACGLMADLGFADCLDWGNAAAAIKCQGWGGRGTLPDHHGMNDLLAGHPRVPLAGPLAKAAQRAGILP